MQKINCENVFKLLSKEYKFGKLFTFDTLESTNKTAKELAISGINEGALVAALSQTAGRGRLGRNFYSPMGSGVYFSLILRPEISPKDSVLITTAASVAVAKAIENITKNNVKIKWVNDIFLNGKKVSGILSEAGFSANENSLDYVILGIGINLIKPKSGFPDDIKNTAGAIFEKEVENSIYSKIILETINAFFDIYKDVTKVDFLNEYKSRSMVLGKEITFERENKKITATVLDIDDRCRLVVKEKSGAAYLISSGEISLGSSNFAE